MKPPILDVSEKLLGNIWIPVSSGRKLYYAKIEASPATSVAMAFASTNMMTARA